MATLEQVLAPYINLEEQAAAPASPAANIYRIYFKTDGKPYFLDDAGIEHCLSPRAWLNYWSGVPSLSTTLYTTKGFLLEPKLEDVVLYGIGMVVGDANTTTYKLAVYQLNGTTQVGAALAISGDVVPISASQPELLVYKFASPITLAKNNRYAVVATNTTSGATVAAIGIMAYVDDAKTGFNGIGYARINNQTPADGVTWEVVASGSTAPSGSALVEV